MTRGERLGFIAFIMFWLMAVAGLVLVYDDSENITKIIFYCAWVLTVIWGAVSGKNVKEVFLKKYDCDKPQSLNPDPKGDS